LYRLKGKRAHRFFDLIYAATGYYELSCRYLDTYKPRAIIFANDHNTDPRALLLAARIKNIPTIYIQHASVSTSFPPLQFNLSLLEGQDAWDKYRQCGPIEGDVKLIGMPKADRYLAAKNWQTTIRTVGICANIIDDQESIQETVQTLSRRFPDLEFTFRPHPGDQRVFNFDLAPEANVEFSEARTEPAFEFLQKQDAIIAADSSIHLEATMLNILSLYYPFRPGTFIDDYYGYVQQGLIERAQSLPVLEQLLEKYKHNRPEVYQRARYYNAVLGTVHEGKSHALAIQIINEFLKQPKLQPA
jgi:hypothetical protein